MPGYDEFEISEANCNNVSLGVFYNNLDYNQLSGYDINSDFSGYTNGSLWMCVSSQPYPYLTLFVDDDPTHQKKMVLLMENP